MLFIASPTYMFFIAKQELKKMPIIGWGITSAGMIYIDRSSRGKAMESMREAGQKAINENKNIVSFPEGSRSPDGKIHSFKRGTFIISKESEIDIIPCAIQGTGRSWPADNMWLKGGKIKVVFGPPISPKDHTEKTAQQFGDFVQKKVEALFATIQ